MKTINTQTTNPINLNTMKTTRTLESFQQFLINIYARKYNGVFLSKESYKSLIKSVIKTLGVTEQYFLNADLKQLKIWQILIQDKPAFQCISIEHRRDLRSGFEAFVNYSRYQAGLISY